MPQPPLTTSPRIPWWLWLNVLSLDAPLVAVLWQAALARVCRLTLPDGCYWALGLAVWIIYMADRVLDSFSNEVQLASTVRHAFYRRHRVWFLVGVIPAATAALGWTALTEVPEGILWRGVGLAFIVGMYLLHYAARGHSTIYLVGNLVASAVGSLFLWTLPIPPLFRFFFTLLLVGLAVLTVVGRSNQGLRLLPKEAICGYLFALGVSLSVHFYSLDRLAGPLSMETLMLGLLCMLNCVAIASYEKESDRLGDKNAITHTWPVMVQLYPALLVGFFVALGLIVSRDAPQGMQPYIVAVLTSLVLLGVVHHLAKKFSPELSHVLADVAVALPMVVLVLGS
ncbi:hypothetical protein [Verrucomicrobium sp. BvORR106]|uniref:hypothetical protein n=1 Tax=Verrucomicrobium sp. BvORR106 TaxID=1403819 RepID=UPI00056DF0A8|nr:hypothetical protein [Verrucomicrobium sp. BvORR106]